MRPFCACCGKPYGNRDVRIEKIVVGIDEPIPPATSNLPMIKEEMTPSLGNEAGGALVALDHGPEFYEGGRGWGFGKYIGRKGRRIIRTFWDGESYRSGYDPFCTLRCAHDFAQASYRAGYRIEAKVPA